MIRGVGVFKLGDMIQRTAITKKTTKKKITIVSHTYTPSDSVNCWEKKCTEELCVY